MLKDYYKINNIVLSGKIINTYDTLEDELMYEMSTNNISYI